MSKKIVVDERVAAARNEGGNMAYLFLTILLFVDLVLHAFIPGMLRMPVEGFPGGLFKEGFPLDLAFLFNFIPLMNLYNGWKRELTVSKKDIALVVGISTVITGILVVVIYMM